MMLINPYIFKSGVSGLNIDFNSFPFVDSTGNFTIVNHGSVTQSSGKALFSNTPGQYLEPIGSDIFKLQDKIKISFKANLTFINAIQILWYMTGASEFGLFIQQNGALVLIMDGAVNYVLTSTRTGFYYNEFLIDVIYDPIAGTLQLLVDGAVEINQTGISMRPNGSRNITVGTDVPAFVNFPIDGTIDDFVVTFPS